MSKLTHKANSDSRILHETPAERGDRARGVVYIDRFPATAREMSKLDIVRDKMLDIINREDGCRLPSMRDGFELHALLLEVSSTAQRNVLESGNLTQISALRRQLIACQIAVFGAT